MKKFTYALMLMLFSTFSVITYAGDTFIAGFETGEAGYLVNDSHWFNQYTWQITDNTESSGINPSDKCFMATTQGTPTDRWGFWMWIDLDQPITITSATRYLKMMGKRSPNTTIMSVGVNNDGYKESTYFGRQKPSKVGVWGDMVFDLFTSWADGTTGETKSCENLEVKTFIIFLGTWEGLEAGTCMLDNIVLSDNDKPRGAKEVQPGLLVNFENTDLTAKNWSSFAVQSAEASYAIDANPVKVKPNETDMAMKYNKPANTTWWHSLMCFSNEIIPVEYPNIYFHAMMYIPDATSTTINITDTFGKEASSKVYPEDGSNWFDYVVDVSELKYINQVAFRFNQDTEENWNNPAGTYWVDDFVLNADPNPRESTTPMGTKRVEFSNVNVYNENGYACIESSELKSASVYSISGQFIAKKSTSDSIIKFILPKGIYIINAESQTGTTSKHKLVIF